MIKPALSNEEWAAFDNAHGERDVPHMIHGMMCERGDLTPTHGDPEKEAAFMGRYVHAVSAVYLARQPFGFTRLDVDRHREQEGTRRVQMVSDPNYRQAHEELADWHRSMADRIEALLPPTTTLTELLDGADWDKLGKPKVGR